MNKRMRSNMNLCDISETAWWLDAFTPFTLPNEEGIRALDARKGGEIGRLR